MTVYGRQSEVNQGVVLGVVLVQICNLSTSIRHPTFLDAKKAKVQK